MTGSAGLPEQVDKYLQLAGVPKEYLQASPAKADAAAWSLGSAFLRRESVYLWGETGVGKSCLAALLVRERMKAYLKSVPLQDCDIKYVPLIVLFTFVPELIMSIKATWKPSSHISERDVIEHYKSIPVLFMDDLGTEETHELVISTLTTIIDSRSRERRLTIFTSNLDINQLGKKLGDRIASRITGMCARGQNIIEMTGADRRLAVQEELTLCR